MRPAKNPCGLWPRCTAGASPASRPPSSEAGNSPRRVSTLKVRRGVGLKLPRAGPLEEVILRWFACEKDQERTPLAQQRIWSVRLHFTGDNQRRPRHGNGRLPRRRARLTHTSAPSPRRPVRPSILRRIPDGIASLPRSSHPTMADFVQPRGHRSTIRGGADVGPLGR